MNPAGGQERRRRLAGERWLPLAFLLLALAAVAPVFTHHNSFADTYDWRLFQSWIEAARRTILWWGQVPLWNPWACGGEVYLANPQSLVATPTIVLPLLFGTALGCKLTLLAYFLFAFDGMYRLGRDLELGPPGAFAASVLFGTGGWLALHLAEGHCTFAGAALFPYLILCYRRALADARWVLALGALSAWIVGLGGTSTPPMACVLLATLATIDAARRSSLRPFMVLVGGAVAAALIGAVRILPALEFALDHPRHLFETDANPLWEMVRNGYWWRGVAPVAHKRYWFHEYGYRLAYLTPPLILWSLAVRKTRWLWIVVLVGAGIVAGSAWPYGPWWLMRHIPLFRDLRVPSRYALFFALALPLLCGGALEDLVARLGRRYGARAAWLLSVAVIVLGAADGLAFDWVRFRNLFVAPWTVAAPGARFYQVRGDWRSMIFHVFANHGAIECDEEAPLERAAELDVGDVPQARLLDPAAGELREERWTPNRIELALALERPTTVMINQNWNEHWKASAGQVVRVGPKLERDLDGGRLGVAVPSGSYTLAVYYRPRSFVVGAAVSAVAIPLSLLLFFVWGRRRPQPPASFNSAH